jgi:LmbE family N-acetylglucosaminyl deacetylase
MHERIAEDRAAMRAIGRRARNLEFLDLQYEGARPDLPLLADTIRAALLPGAHVYAPAGLGAHPDHRTVRDVALMLLRDGFTVSLYAELPHASARGWPAWVDNGLRSSSDVAGEWRAELARTGIPAEHMVPTVRALSEHEHARKLRVVRFYASQLESLEAKFGRSISDPSLLRCEVEWELPG